MLKILPGQKVLLKLNTTINHYDHIEKIISEGEGLITKISQTNNNDDIIIEIDTIGHYPDKQTTQINWIED